MKKLNLFVMSFSQNIISSIIMLIILSFALISMQDVIGQYRYCLLYTSDAADE